MWARLLWLLWHLWPARGGLRGALQETSTGPKKLGIRFVGLPDSSDLGIALSSNRCVCLSRDHGP